MLLSYTWLQHYLPKLPAPEKLAELFMLHGLDVESVRAAGDQYDHVVVGEIVGIKPHPNADKLRLADVVITPGGSPQEIVCGAPNIAVGQKAPVALIGAKLPNGLTIEPRAIRGVTSNGMLCAEDELGLGKSHAGILILDPKLPVGMPVAQALGLNDVILDVTTPANRADLMSVRGLAREIGVMLGQAPASKEPKLTESSAAAAKSITVKSASTKLSPLFTVRVIRGTSLKPTPAHIVQRLNAAGMRSINAIVDCTNYIMLEYGQPLHAYDAAKVSDATLQVRLATAGERLTTLDGKDRELAEDMIVISDGKNPVGLAGVMGGKNTEVSSTTTDIILEAAIFDPVAIRKTSRRLGLVSEASKRFEKGLWSALTLEALDAAAAMIIELGGGTIEKGIVKAGKATSAKRSVKIVPAYITERIGQPIPTATAKAVLQHLGFGVNGTAKLWTVEVPVWRPDVSLPEDIVDEVGRMVGYANLPESMPDAVAVKELPGPIRFQEEVKNILVDLGLTEIISHAFYGERSAAMIVGQHFELANPLDATQHKLRKSLLPQVEEVLRSQADAGHDANIFEVGYIFDPSIPGEIDRQQVWKLALGVTEKGEGTLNQLQAAFQKKLGTKVEPEGKVVQDLVRGRRIEFCEFDLKTLMSTATIHFGPWDPNRHVKTKVIYKEPSKFPAIKRDISMFFEKKEHKASNILDKASEALGESIKITRMLLTHSTYEGKTNWLLKLTFQAPDRTLTKSEVDAIMARLVSALTKLGATIR